MKQIHNLSTGIRVSVDGKLTEAVYTDLIKLVLKHPKAGGYTYEDIAIRVRLNNVCDIFKTPQSFEISDDDGRYLVSLIQTMRWSFWHPDLLTFKNDMETWLLAQS